MNGPFVLIIAGIVISLIFIGLYLTYNEFHQGSGSTLFSFAGSNFI